MKNNISTKVLPGFMELLPADQISFNKMKSTIQKTYESFGFVAIDTPIIEKSEILFTKAGGETEKQIYRLSKGETELALRFDLTVPLARYVSEHFNNLSFPFKRYHIGKVYRGERPQKGRYREFYQCDIDIIGKDKLSLINDAEILAVIYDVFLNLKLPKFKIRISNRKLISGLLKSFNLENKAVDVMRIIDKFEKMGQEFVKKSLVNLGLSEDAVEKIISFIGINGSNHDVINSLERLKINNDVFTQGLSELKSVIEYVEFFSLPIDYYGIDLSIARGLDYYTGTVYETILVDYSEVGSICSGGRYDNLADSYTKHRLPGVGISIGLTRLFSQLKDLQLLNIKESTPAKVIIIPFDNKAMVNALKLGKTLREKQIATEIYFEESKFKNKLSYANKLGIKFVILIGEDEIEGNYFTIKDMDTGKQNQLNLEKLLITIKN